MKKEDSHWRMEDEGDDDSGPRYSSARRAASKSSPPIFMLIFGLLMFFGGIGLVVLGNSVGHVINLGAIIEGSALFIAGVVMLAAGGIAARL